VKKTFIIFKKELLDTLRDKRTILVMIIIPLLLFPILINIATKITIKQRQKAEEKILNVALILNKNAESFKSLLKDNKKINLKENVKEHEITNKIRNGNIDFAIIFNKDFDSKVNARESGVVNLYYKSSEEVSIQKSRIVNLLKEFEDDLIFIRFKELKINRSIVKAVEINEHDIASMKEKFGEKIGGFLPYIFIIFCFIGAMYPAIDLGAGEKERSTLETLLVSPAKRLQIVYGKFGVIFLAGILTAAISVFSLFLALKTSQEIPEEILTVLLRIVDYKSILLVFTLLIPLCAFFAALLLSISIFAHSFKEAQSIMTPFNFLVIFPVFIGLFPGVKLDSVTALIPVLNVSLATKEIISGTIKAGLLAEVYISLLILAGLSLYFCSKWFQREDIIFRGA
jgi:sodium transport system permease protein